MEREKSVKKSDKDAAQVFDLIDLKDLLIKLCLKDEEVVKEKEKYVTSLAQYEESFADLKKKFSVYNAKKQLVSAKDVLGDEYCDYYEEGDKIASNSMSDRKFALLNKKLEVQILISEIKNALPTLESIIEGIDSKNKQIIKDNDQVDYCSREDIFCKNVEELDKSIGDAIENKLLLKGKCTNDRENNTIQKNKLSKDISMARQHVELHLDELETIKDINHKINRTIMSEEAKIKTLGYQLTKLRLLIGQFHNGKGWEVESFLHYSGSINGMLDANLVQKALAPWLLPEEIDTLAILMTKQFREYQTFDLHTYLKLCDAIMS